LEEVSVLEHKTNSIYYLTIKSLSYICDNKIIVI